MNDYDWMKPARRHRRRSDPVVNGMATRTESKRGACVFINNSRRRWPIRRARVITIHIRTPERTSCITREHHRAISPITYSSRFFAERGSEILKWSNGPRMMKHAYGLSSRAERLNCPIYFSDSHFCERRVARVKRYRFISAAERRGSKPVAITPFLGPYERGARL